MNKSEIKKKSYTPNAETQKRWKMWEIIRIFQNLSIVLKNC